MKNWQPNLGEPGPWDIPASGATVISGGQVGADIAALRAGRACGLATGGSMPKGFRTLFGPMPPEDVELYGMREHESYAYPPRTEDNVRTADGTIRFAYNFQSPGERCTLRFIKKHQLPHFDVLLIPENNGFTIDPWDWYRAQVVKWIYDEEIEILNVAGNANTNIEPVVERFLVQVFQALARREDDAG